jgi:hypothetical protein
MDNLFQSRISIFYAYGKLEFLDHYLLGIFTHMLCAMSFPLMNDLHKNVFYDKSHTSMQIYLHSFHLF